MAIIRWITFAWGCLASLVMAYFAFLWVLESTNPLRHEYGIGLAIGMVYGLPAWLGLPVLAFIERGKLSRATVMLLLAPVVLAFVSTLFLAFMGGFNR